MAKNKISYEGRIIARDSKPEFGFAGSLAVLKLTIAEQHSAKNKQCQKDPNLKKYYDPTKATEDYVNTTTSWHKLTVMGDLAERYAQDADFNHGALIVVEEASYTEEGDWETKDGVKRAGRPEMIGDRQGSIEIKFSPRVRDGEQAPTPIWDGLSTPKIGGNGGGGQQREYDENEGF